MSDYVDFEGRVIPMEWGDSTYTVLPLPPEVVSALADARRVEVEGEINDYPVNLAITKAPVLDAPFLWTGKSLLDRADIEPGDVGEVRLRPADPNEVDVPDDVALALRAAGLSQKWEAWTPGKKRAALHKITSAKREATRLKRIADLTDEVRQA